MIKDIGNYEIESDIFPPFEAYTGNQPYLFVSYSHKDEVIVYPIIEILYKMGIPIWYDEGIEPGDEWLEILATAIKKSHTFLVFMSQNAINSKWVKKEINLAVSEYKKERIIQVYLQKTELTPGMKLQLSDIQAIFKYKLDMTQFYSKLEKILKVLVKKDIIKEDKIIIEDSPYDLYRKGRLLANSGVWKASEAFYSKAAKLFGILKTHDWEARSLGRSAFNLLDQGKIKECKVYLDRAFKADSWQGAANYYWAIEHCARGASNVIMAKYFFEKLLKAFNHIGILSEIEISILDNQSLIEKYYSFLKSLIDFFEELIVHEVNANWPLWSMSDLARIYQLKAVYDKENSEIYFNLAANSYDDAEMTSRANWTICKSKLLQASKKTTLLEIGEILKEVINQGKLILQKPGGEKDITIYYFIILKFYNNLISAVLEELKNNTNSYFSLISKFREDFLNEYILACSEAMKIKENLEKNPNLREDRISNLIKNIRFVVGNLPWIGSERFKHFFIKFIDSR